MKSRATRHRFALPIYGCDLYIIVNDTPYVQRMRMEHLFGKSKAGDNWAALCSSEGPNFGLFFHPNPPIETVAHEVFHLTHRILDWADVKFDSEHHESGALLHGYLMQLVLNVVSKD